jgi:hypothetical protein
MRAAPLVLLAVACQTAEHDELSKELAPYRGSRVVSNVLAAPAGARWKLARVETHVFEGGGGKTEPFRKSWSVQTDLVVEYPDDQRAATRLANFSEGSESARDIVTEAALPYHLRARAELGLVDYSTGGGKSWHAIEVPVPYTPDAGVD